MNIFYRISDFKKIISFHLSFTVKFRSVLTVLWDQKDLAGFLLGLPATMNTTTVMLAVVTAPQGVRDILHPLGWGNQEGLGGDRKSVV